MPTDSGNDQQALLEELHTLARETRGGAEIPPPDLNTRLDRDLGLDSLARGELLQRLERRYRVALPNSAINAGSAGELWRCLQAARTGEDLPATTLLNTSITAADGVLEPSDALTLNQVLLWHTHHHPERDYGLIHDDDGTPRRLSIADLHQGAGNIARALILRGIRPGDGVALMLPTGVDYFFCFFGCLLAGAVAIPLYPPLRPSQLEEHLRRHGRILDNARCRCLITIPAVRPLARWFQAQVESLDAILTPADLQTPRNDVELPQVNADQLAFLQYTSGSTGDPKGVMLSHANLLANIRAAGRRGAARPTDVFVSWLPLYHDMGLIGSALFTLYHGIPAIIFSPLTFLRRPLSWLEAVDRHRGTLSAAPNFAFERCLRDVSEAEAARLDLSCWRYLLNGAEPVNPDTMRRFAAFFAASGLRPQVLSPSYGLAENTVALALPPPDRGLRLETVDRELFRRQGIAKSPTHPGAPTLDLVGCGHAIPGHRLRVVDEAGKPLDDGYEGELEFRGPSACAGYFRHPAATAALRHGDWWRTGDRGLLLAGEVFVTGRSKDLIIRHGRNLYPYQLEQAVGQLDGVRRGCVAVFAHPRDQGGEILVVAAETRISDEPQRQRLQQHIQSLTSEWLDTPADEVVLMPPHTVLKTSSGKIRRRAMADLYGQGLLGKPPRHLWWQLTRLALEVLSRRIRVAMRQLGRILGQLRGSLCIGIGALLAAVLAGSLPRRLAYPAVAQVGRWCLRGAGIGVTLRDMANLQPPCLLVINHASYLDGPVLLAHLPLSVRFVVKGELASNPWLGPVLRRLNVLFVNRWDLDQAQAETERLIAIAREGEVLGIFPEGTFPEQAGILPFRSGAFITAARTGVPVVPVIIKGTRQVLPPEGGLPRPGAISIQVLPPMSARGDDWSAAMALRDAVRELMVETTGEPPLDQDDSPLAG